MSSLKNNTYPASVKVPKGLSKETAPKPFPIVGFGASAGGIAAFTTLIKHLDVDLGMAYVLVMHLSPHHKSALAEIIQTNTRMLVHTVEDGMEVMANNIYVIPPDTFMSITDGHLKLAPRSLPSLGNFGVDYFLNGLASVYKNNAIGVILSGNASDGTLGLKAIKAEGGITFAQDDSAEFSGMPVHAFDSGYVDFRLSPEGIANELARLVKVPYTCLPSEKIEEQQIDDIDDHTEELKKILLIVKTKTGVDFFANYKRASIYRRLLRRMALNKCEKIKQYYLFLLENSEEVDALYKDFLINVTYFFRDPLFFKALVDDVFPSIISRNPVEGIRIWVAGCSTGEEAYSIAICLTEFLETRGYILPIRIFASDLDDHAIEKARTGLYPLSALQGVSEKYLSLYFNKLDGHYQIIKSVRERCIFTQHNLLSDPPFSGVDLISCQNVMIYLEAKPQEKILQTFHYALKTTGYLFLGKSETIGTTTELFEQGNKKLTLYKRKPTYSPQLQFTIDVKGNGASREPRKSDVRAKVENDISKLILSRYVHPIIVVDKGYRIMQFFGSVAPFLEPATGQATLNVLKMIKEELVIDLGQLLHEAKKTDKSVVKGGIKIYGKKSVQELTLEVVPNKTAGDIYFIIVLKEGAVEEKADEKTKTIKKRVTPKEKIIQKLEEELIQSRKLIRTTHEEFETTYEEFQANNEEILSSNEELQSVNEELETSKEELQSSIEELTSTNKELQVRNAELDNSRKELEKLNAQLTEFAFISSHDLQEPLRKISIFSERLSDAKSALNEHATKYAEKINGSAIRMSALITDLLTFSTLTKDYKKQTRVDLTKTVSNVLEDFSLIIEEKEAVVRVSHLPVILAEPVQMNHLFHNLIGNALKFSVTDPRIDIHFTNLSAEERGLYPQLAKNRKYGCIAVKDNGVGFEQKHVPKIFALFQRLDTDKKTTGTGMGLAICKKIVEDHGGIILALGEKNKGSTFTVILPVR